MTWRAQLNLRYYVRSNKTLLDFSHEGPLRILQSLYPEGEGICHNVIVHPPGGVAGGDHLAIAVSIEPGAHALVTTPGATRFYRTDTAPAIQHTRLQVAADARIEWLPLENIAYSGCLAENRLELQLAPGGQMIGWDITALGLPAAGLPFSHGRFVQHLALLGEYGSHTDWLERGCMDASDTRLLQSPLGLAGQPCIASLIFASGDVLPLVLLDRLRDSARALAEESMRMTSHTQADLAHTVKPQTIACGVTSPHSRVVVLRALGPSTEVLSTLLKQVRMAWRTEAWSLAAITPRIWST
jgi:urease accessory protein